MPKTRSPYPRESRKPLITLLCTSRGAVDTAAEEHPVSDQAPRTRRHQAGADAGRGFPGP